MSAAATHVAHVLIFDFGADNGIHQADHFDRMVFALRTAPLVLLCLNLLWCHKTLCKGSPPPVRRKEQTVQWNEMRGESKYNWLFGLQQKIFCRKKSIFGICSQVSCAFTCFSTRARNFCGSTNIMLLARFLGRIFPSPLNSSAALLLIMQFGHHCAITSTQNKVNHAALASSLWHFVCFSRVANLTVSPETARQGSIIRSTWAVQPYWNSAE